MTHESAQFWLMGISSAYGLEIGGLLTFLFAGLARWLRGVTWSGAVAGAVICFLLYAGGGPGTFFALITVFILAWSTTKAGYQRKQKLGTAERKGGRTASQVCANLSVAAICCAVHLTWLKNPVLFLGAAAALSEAAADTVSSEIGQISDRAHLVTTWQTVPAGIDGGITLAGTIAGIGAAIIVGAVCAVTHLIPWSWLGFVIFAAVLGMFADSFLGAVLERRGLLNNDMVNFLGTLFTACTAALLVLI
jgi:uncharacterized protein (TIGR00297 family)